jgi:flagellar protein FlaG
MSVASVSGATAIPPVAEVAGSRRDATVTAHPGFAGGEAGSRPAVAPTVARLREATAQIENFVRSSGRDLQFRVNDASGRVVVSVRDSATGELIRQIPSEEALRIAEQLAAATSLSDVSLIADQEI